MKLLSVSPADLDLISFLKGIPDSQNRRGIRIPAWHLLLVAVLGILSHCQSLRDLERFAIRHHCVLSDALGLKLRRPPSDSALPLLFSPGGRGGSERCYPRLDDGPVPWWRNGYRSAGV